MAGQKRAGQGRGKQVKENREGLKEASKWRSVKIWMDRIIERKIGTKITGNQEALF